MSGPIVRSGPSPQFSKNWDSVFGKGGGKKSAPAADKGAGEKGAAKAAKKKVAKKAAPKKAAKKGKK
jgi:hypothetical protein